MTSSGPLRPSPADLRLTRRTADWQLTVRQSIPDLWTLSRSLRPTFRLAGAASIDESFIREHRIHGIIWDVDGTLMRYHDSDVDPSLQEWFRSLLTLPAVRHVIVSNCGEERLAALAAAFRHTPVLRMYATGRGPVYRRLHGGLDAFTPGEPAAQLDRSFRHHRKPSRELIEYAIRELGCHRDHVVVVGDQYFTDVASANLAGIRSVKVPTMAPESFPPVVRLLQLIERAFAPLAIRLLPAADMSQGGIGGEPR